MMCPIRSDTIDEKIVQVSQEIEAQNVKKNQMYLIRFNNDRFDSKRVI